MCHVVVVVVLRVQRDRNNRRVRHHRAEFPAESDVLVFRPTPFFNRFVRVTNNTQRVEFVEVTNEVLAPVTNPDDREVDLSPTDRSVFHEFLAHSRRSTHLPAAYPSP